jgi:hypothetical protein
MLGGVMRNVYPHLNYDEYPAHLHINLNEGACRLYEKTGFKLLDTRQTRVCCCLVNQNLEIRSYGLKLVDS